MKTAEEVQALKNNWRSDPCWDIEDTEGFETHRAELLEWRKEYEAHCGVKPSAPIFTPYFTWVRTSKGAINMAHVTRIRVGYNANGEDCLRLEHGEGVDDGFVTLPLDDPGAKFLIEYFVLAYPQAPQGGE